VDRRFHPEFAFLPRKFKIAVSGVDAGPRGDRMVHDIGLQALRERAGRGRLRGARRRRHWAARR
jgi:sulfite reductase (NADPH) hemoprotein beta-component